MRFPTLRAALGAGGLAVLLASCAGSSQPSAMPAAQSGAPLASVARASIPEVALPWIQRALHPLHTAPSSPAPRAPGGKFGEWLYAVHLYDDDIKVFRRSGVNLTYDETLSGFSAPMGAHSTQNQWWYVTDATAQDILAFRSTHDGPAGPDSVLADTGQEPVNVDLTPSRNIIVVSNASTTSGGSGSVSVYVNRIAQPNRILTYGSDELIGEGIALDKQGNCYWSFNDQNTGTGSIVVFDGCNGSGRPFATGLGFAGGLTFDQKGDLFYVDQTKGVFGCRKLASCEPLKAQFVDALNINFDQKSKDLWVGDVGNGNIDAVDPKSGQIVYSQNDGGPSDPPFGIAPAPGG